MRRSAAVGVRAVPFRTRERSGVVGMTTALRANGDDVCDFRITARDGMHPFRAASAEAPGWDGAQAVIPPRSAPIRSAGGSEVRSKAERVGARHNRGSDPVLSTPAAKA